MRHHLLDDLRKSLAVLAPQSGPHTQDGGRLFSFGDQAVDDVLGGGLRRGALHEFCATSPVDAAAPLGLVLGLAARAAAGRPVLLIRQRYLDLEHGHVHGPGLLELGLDPRHFILLRTQTVDDALRAATDAARCAGLGAVVIMLARKQMREWLSLSRKFALFAKESGVAVLLLDQLARAEASAALTRWQIATAPSLALAGHAPGYFRCVAKLTRDRAGMAPRLWHLEWNRDELSFNIYSRITHQQSSGQPLGQALPRPVVPAAANRPSDGVGEERKAG
jgi:protein ImuA